MSRRTTLALCLASAFVLPVASASAEKKKDEKPLAEAKSDAAPLALVGATVHPVTSEPIDDGVVLLRDGRIEAVLRPDSRRLRGRDLEAEGYRVLDVSGRHVYPGLVTSGADSLGLSFDVVRVGRREALGSRLVDVFDARSDVVELAVAAGITSAHVYHDGSTGKPISGRGAVLKMSYGEPRGVLVKEPASAWLGRDALTAKGMFDLRQLFEKASEWRGMKKAKRKPNDELALVSKVARGEIPLFIPASTAGEVALVLDLAREMPDLRPVVYHSTEAWVLADELAAADIPVVQHVRTAWFKPRADRRHALSRGWRFDAPAQLARAGVDVTVVPYTDGVATWGIAGRDLSYFPMEAAFAQRGGLTPQEALESITIGPARLLGVADRVGSIEVGKDADVIVTDGDVLDYRTLVRQAIVSGHLVYEAEGNRHWGWVTERRERHLATGAQEPFVSAPNEAAWPSGPERSRGLQRVTPPTR